MSTGNGVLTSNPYQASSIGAGSTLLSMSKGDNQETSSLGSKRFQISKGVNHDRIFPVNLTKHVRYQSVIEKELPRDKVWYLTEGLPRQKVVADKIADTIKYFNNHELKMREFSRGRFRHYDDMNKQAMKKII